MGQDGKVGDLAVGRQLGGPGGARLLSQALGVVHSQRPSSPQEMDAR